MKKIIYLLLGSDACEVFDEKGVDALIVSINEENIGYVTYKWDSDNHDVLDLLSTFQGMWDYSVMSEEEFNKLNAL